jgi:chemotaxis protein CheX
MTLPAGLDTAGAGAIAAQLAAARGKPLTLDASAVERVGALGLQVLLSARLTWAQDGGKLKIERPSAAFAAALARAGVAFEFDRSA